MADSAAMNDYDVDGEPQPAEKVSFAPDPDEREFQYLEDVMAYEVAGGTEQYISFEDFEKDLLVGFCRLRFPNDPVRRELADAAVVRELHVYGSQVGVGEAATADDGDGGEDPVGEHQHQGYGRRLLAEAERLATDAGYGKLAVLSGIGVREYYREKLGYKQDGPYVSKRIE